MGSVSQFILMVRGSGFIQNEALLDLVVPDKLSIMPQEILKII